MLSASAQLNMLNGTIWMMIYTAKMMSNLPEKNNTGNVTVIQDTGPTNLSPEVMRNQPDLHDDWHDWAKWRCYNPYGCYSNEYPWSGEHRPVYELPEDPEKIDPRYFLYTRNSIEKPHELKIDNSGTIRNSPLRARNDLYFIIHGFLENGDKTWVMRTMKELLIREECNVVIVNWIAGARPPYTQAVANTRLVGAMTARLAAQLIEFGGISPMKMHVIGHSLGGHTAGYVGYYLRTTYKYELNRITGLDPAEPHFRDTDPEVRLDPTDATFVTAIHTDCNLFISGGLGITQAVAHIDFYPNGGRNQPGCNEGVLNSISSENGSVILGLKKFLGCNHIRSYEYFIESINSPCPFLSVPCTSWDEFRNGSCFDCVNQYCPRFGLDAQPGNYHAAVYLMTGSEKPFCKGHYKVTINTAKTNESMLHNGEIGIFVIRVIGTNGKTTEKMKLNDTPKYYAPDSTHTVVLPGDIVDKPNSVEITWEYEMSFFNPLSWRMFPRHYIDSVTIETLETNYEITLCPDNMTLIANQPKILTTEYCHIIEHNVVST